MSINKHQDKLLALENMITQQDTYNKACFDEHKENYEKTIKNGLSSVTDEFNSALTSLDEKYGNTIAEMEKKYNSQIEIMASQINSLILVQSKSKKEEEKTGGESPSSPTNNDKIPLNPHLEERIAKLEKSLETEVEFVKTDFLKKIKDVERKIEAMKLDDVSAPKEEVERISKILSEKTEKSEPIKIEGMNTTLTDDKAIEMYQRYLAISKELERFKQLVVNGYQPETKEYGLKQAVKTYERRIFELEQAKEDLEVEVTETVKKQEGILSTLNMVQKTFAERLRVKLNVEGSSEPRASPIHSMPMTSSVVGSSMLKQEEKPIQKIHRPSMKNVMNIGKSSVNHSRVDDNDNEDKFSAIWKEINKLAPKDFIERLENAIKNIQTILPNKLDKIKLDTLEQDLRNKLDTINSTIRQIKEDTEISFKSIVDMKNQVKQVVEIVNTFDPRVKAVESGITNTKFTLDELKEKINQRATGTELMILKNSMNETTEKIDKLAKLLEESYSVDDVGSASFLKGESTQKDRKTLKFIIFQCEQRIEELEKKIYDLKVTQELDEFNGDKDILLKTVGVQNSSRNNNASAASSQKPDQGGVKGMIAKQDMVLNEMNLRLTDLESNMHKLEPNNIRALIRDIAELILHEETKEVAATVDALKGNEKRNETLVELLKNELKVLDERFKVDIEKKIEKKDLYVAKSQLQRKVFFYVQNQNKSYNI